MTTLKKLFSLSLALLIVFTLSVPVLAHDTNAETSVPTSAFDWNEYEDELAEADYHFRANVALNKEELHEYIIYLLITDGIVPRTAFSSDAINKSIFIDFVENNVHIEYINTNQRGYTCCGNARRFWKENAFATFNSANWCIKHTYSRYYVCVNCQTIWDKETTTDSGCGGFKYEGHGYAVCYLPSSDGT